MVFSAVLKRMMWVWNVCMQAVVRNYCKN